MKKIILVILLSLSIMGCSTHLTKTSYNLEAGMSKQVVIQKMGLPDRRSFRGTDEALQYSEIVGFGQCSYIIVWLTNDKVKGITSRSGSSIAGCGLGSKEVDWGQMPKPSLHLNIKVKKVQ
jgi:hypothetical protein